MTVRAHSTFPASSSARLLECPGSYAEALRLDTGERKANQFSAEGTLAHAIAEVCLATGNEPHDYIGQTRWADGFQFTIDEDFADNVKVYVDFARGLQGMGYVLRLETRVSPQVWWGSLPPLNIELFGTSDLIAVDPVTGHVVIADLKFGRGVPVDAKGNPQLLYYAAGALGDNILQAMLGKNYKFNNNDPDVDLVIVQPRAFHPEGPIRKADPLKRSDIINWACTGLYYGVERALNDNGKTFNPSKHCRWCPAITTCNAMQGYANEAAKRAFANVPLDGLDPTKPQTLPAVGLSDRALGDLLDRVAVVMPLFTALQALGEERLASGRDVQGWKRIPKLARRSWTLQVEQDVLDALAVSGVGPDEVTKSELMTPSEVERKLGKSKYNQIVAPLVSRKSSGHNLVPDADPRSRLKGRTAKEAFTQVSTHPSEPSES